MKISQQLPLVRLGLAMLVSLVLLGVSGCQPPLSPRQSAIVSQVINGQTIEVRDATGANPIAERIRLLGIAAPSAALKPWGQDAKQHLDQLLPNNTPIQLEFDLQPRTLSSSDESPGEKTAYIWQGDRLINELLVAEGYVLARSIAPNIKYERRLSNAQEQARLLGLGIWNPEHPLRSLSSPSGSRPPTTSPK